MQELVERDIHRPLTVENSAFFGDDVDASMAENFHTAKRLVSKYGKTGLRSIAARMR